MDREQKKSWARLMTAWNEDRVACHIYLARLYTQEYPDDMFGWIVLADALCAIASYGEAMLALRTARRLSPNDTLDFVYHQTGHYYNVKGDYRRAEGWYRRAVHEKDTSRNLIFLGACLAKQGKYREAKQYHRRAIRDGSELSDEAYFNLGLILRAEGKLHEALECLERAIEIDPKYTLAKKARKDIVTLLKLKEGI